MAKDSDPFVRIASSIGGFSLAIVLVFAIFAESELAYAVPIVLALAIMGMVLGNFARRKK